MNGLESIRCRSFQLREKLALITGASGGIGRALSLGFAEAGARLALVTRRSSNLDELRKALPDSTEVEVYEVDLSAGAATSRLIAEVVARQDALDILINCAGVPLTKDAIDVSEEDWNAVVDVNLKSLSCARPPVRSWPGEDTERLSTSVPHTLRPRHRARACTRSRRQRWST